MYFRIVTILLLIFVLIAYIDTKSLRQNLDDAKILREYKNSSKLIGIGLKDENGKVEVKDVISNTPAEKSGIQDGDILINVDGNENFTAKTIQNYLQNIKKDKKVALKIKKPDNSIVEITLTPTLINNFE